MSRGETPSGRHTRTVLRGIGKTCISAGLLILAFVAYQLWGTGITESRAQHKLREEFSTPAPIVSGPIQIAAPVPGQAVALLHIPRIGVDAAVVEGVSVDNLQHGPGHYPGTPLPGQKGNAAIAGHRTTYGAPFYRLDELKPGDDILVTTRDSPTPYHYQVISSASVSPDDTAVLDPTADNRLTLTTCTPRFTATKRLIVVSKLVGAIDPKPVAPSTAHPTQLQGADTNSLSGQSKSRTPAVLWGLLCLLIWFLGWLFGQRWKRWPAYLITSPVFVIALFFFFQSFARFVPANI